MSYKPLAAAKSKSPEFKRYSSYNKHSKGVLVLINLTPIVIAFNPQIVTLVKLYNKREREKTQEIKQFTHSLKSPNRHSRTLLNIYHHSYYFKPIDRYVKKPKKRERDESPDYYHTRDN